MEFKEKNLNWFLRVKSLGAVARAIFPTEIEGGDLIPDEPFILVVGPHKTGKETVLVPSYLQEYEFHIMAKAELFNVPVFGWILRNAGGIPVVRTRGRGIDAITPAVEEIKKGFPVLIFPEGTRHSDGVVHEGKTGAIRIALESGAPLVLASLEGMTKRGRKTKRSIRIVAVYYPRDELRLLELEMGKPIPYPTANRLLTDQMMQRLAEGAHTFYVPKAITATTPVEGDGRA